MSDSAEPAGPMAVGQHIEARANGLRVTLDVLTIGVRGVVNVLATEHRGRRVDRLMAEVIEGHIRDHAFRGARPTSEEGRAAQDLVDIIRSYLK